MYQQQGYAGVASTVVLRIATIVVPCRVLLVAWALLAVSTGSDGCDAVAALDSLPIYS